MAVPLAPSTPAALGLDPQPLERLGEIITGHLAEGRYPGAQIAVARRGQLALFRTFGDARLEPARAAAREDTLWLMYSNTKVITACAVWILAERGALRYTDRVADHVPGFEAHGKGDITIIQLLSHQAGFPNADVPKEAWTDHDLLRRTVCDYTLEWTPGSRVVYHGRAAHWTAAVMIEALTKTDYRAFIRENITEPLGLGRELYVGLPDGEHAPRGRHARAGVGCGAPDQARGREHAGVPARGRPGRGRLRHGAGDGGVLPDAGAGGIAQRRAPALAAHRAVRDAQRDGRPRGRLHGHAHAPRARAPRARHHRVDPRPGQHRLAADLRPWGRGVVILLGAIPTPACRSRT